MRIGLLSALPAVFAAFAFTGCVPNEERVIRDYLSTLHCDEGRLTSIETGKYTFHSFEEIGVDGKFVYSLTGDGRRIVDKDSVFSEMKRCVALRNDALLMSVIFFKRSVNCSVQEWRREMDYKDRYERLRDDSFRFGAEADILGKVYRNFDDAGFVLFKAVYSYKEGGIEANPITAYFVYDRADNRVLKRFDELAADFIEYYGECAEGIDMDGYDDLRFLYYDDLLDRPLNELMRMAGKM